MSNSVRAVNNFIAGVAWRELSLDEIRKIPPLESGFMANTLYSGMVNAGIRKGPSRPWGPDAQAVQNVLDNLRARANGTLPAPVEKPVSKPSAKKRTKRSKRNAKR